MTTATRNIEVLYGADEFVKAWMAEQLPSQPIDRVTDYAAFGVISRGRMIAGFLFHNFFKMYGTIELGVVATSPMWANKTTMAELFDYPFHRWQVNKLWCAIAVKNERAINTAEHAGFKREATLADEYGPGKHAVRLRILKREFK